MPSELRVKFRNPRIQSTTVSNAVVLALFSGGALSSLEPRPADELPGCCADLCSSAAGDAELTPASPGDAGLTPASPIGSSEAGGEEGASFQSGDAILCLLAVRNSMVVSIVLSQEARVGRLRNIEVRKQRNAVLAGQSQFAMILPLSHWGHICMSE